MEIETKVESLQEENQELRICISEMVANGPPRVSFVPRKSEEKTFESNRQLDLQMTQIQRMSTLKAPTQARNSVSIQLTGNDGVTQTLQLNAPSRQSVLNPTQFVQQDLGEANKKIV